MAKLQIYWKCLILFLATEALTSDLPTYSLPTHYSLDLVLDPRASTYEGFVEINFNHTNATINLIRLHASYKTLIIKEALLNYQETCTATKYDEDLEIVTFECPEKSLKDENSLTIQFQGNFSTEDMNGLYKSTYTEEGDENVLLATQFESVAARRAFPCFDEPSLKATYDIFITHPIDYDVLANTPAVKAFAISADQIQAQFETTPPMSTYLVAFVVSKFSSNSDNKVRAYDYKVFSRPGAKDFTGIATSYGPTLIDLLSNWTGIKYADLGNTQAYQVAIPDFSAGAMENWGLITFREVDLLDDEETTSNAAKQRIITTIAHELSHQWFGDYVTLDWWSNTWLNEGFATYFEYYIPDQLDDKLDTMKQFVVNELQPVLQVDSLSSALPLTSDAGTAAEIDNKFDDISYSKGGSVIRMLRNVIGETAFRNALQSYLSTNQYGNTNAELLLSSFAKETKLDVKKVMDNWIYESGFPLVTVTLNESNVVLTQERFTLQNASDIEPTQWYIPVTYTTSEEKNFNVNTSAIKWIEPNSSLEIPVNDKSWIIFNIQQIGYFRVNYEDQLWHRLIMALEDNKENIDVLNRAQLVDDAFNVARAGYLSYEMAFHLAGYLEFETEYYPWVSALNALSFITGKLNDDEAEELLRSRILYWINKAFPANTDFGTGHVDVLKDVLIENWACKLGQEDCIKYAKEKLEDYKSNISLPDYNKRSIVFCYGFRNSENAAEDYEFFGDLFKNTESVVEKNEIISALGCAKSPEILSDYLLATISENSVIRKQDAALVFKAVYTQSTTGVEVSLDFLEQNLNSITAKYKGMNALSNLVLGLANKVISDDHITRLTKIIQDNTKIEEIQLVGQRALEVMAANRNWTDTYAATIKKVLKDSPSDASGSQPPTLFFIILFSIYYLIHG